MNYANDDGNERHPDLAIPHSMVVRLGRLTHRLRLLGLLTLFLTLLNITVLVGGVIDAIYTRQFNSIHSQDIANYGTAAMYFSFWWLIANLTIFVVSMILLGFSDSFRKSGDALFQEVSNAFQEISLGKSLKIESELAAAEARISLRDFSSAADPPLIRGRYGAAIYALVNIVIILTAVILYSQFA